MKCMIRTFLAFVLLVGVAPAATISLFDFGFNIDGTVSVPTMGDPLPAAVDASAFDTLTGLGTLTATVFGAGIHNVHGFFDHEIDVLLNTSSNETGAAVGAPIAGQSWEIDEPGFVDGDIFNNFQAGALDNQTAISVFGNTLFPDDVSMAIAFDFTLAAGEQAVIDFVIREEVPTLGFYLSHNDADSNATIYLSSTLTISPIAVPEPGTVLLLGLALLGVSAVHRRALAPQGAR